MILRISRRLLVALLALVSAALVPLSARAAAGAFHLDVDLNVHAALVDLDPSNSATANNPAEPGADSSEAALAATLKRLEVRRNMLVVHQVMAWTSLSSIIAAEVVGMTNRVALQSGSILRDDLDPSLGAHRGLAAAAIGTYYTAGIMAWLSPGPGGTRKPGDKGFSEWKNTRDVHIAFSIAHNITMAMTIVTGALQANAVGAKNWEGMVATHTLMAFTTVGLMIPAAVVISRF